MRSRCQDNLDAGRMKSFNDLVLSEEALTPEAVAANVGERFSTLKRCTLAEIEAAVFAKAVGAAKLPEEVFYNKMIEFANEHQLTADWRGWCVEGGRLQLKILRDAENWILVMRLRA